VINACYLRGARAVLFDVEDSVNLFEDVKTLVAPRTDVVLILNNAIQREFARHAGLRSFVVGNAVGNLEVDSSAGPRPHQLSGGRISTVALYSSGFYSNATLLALQRLCADRDMRLLLKVNHLQPARRGPGDPFGQRRFHEGSTDEVDVGLYWPPEDHTDFYVSKPQTKMSFWFSHGVPVIFFPIPSYTDVALAFDYRLDASTFEEIGERLDMLNNNPGVYEQYARLSADIGCYWAPAGLHNISIFGQLHL